jgi:membrane-bound metal-dependent hydrolase YbcI (DUF457 family)
MAQAGIHGLAGMAVKKWTPERTWLLLGIVLGNIFPDLDNIAVAVATIIGKPTEGLHRTFTHSLFTVAAVILFFYLVGRVRRQSRWLNLGIGLGIGILMHILLDLVIWFNGVELLWPIPLWVNFWEGVTPPEWWSKLMLPVEFFFLALFFLLLGRSARLQDTDTEYLPKLRIWTMIQLVLFVVFLVLVYTMQSGFMTPYGAVYLLSLGLALGVTVRMRDTIETSTS